MILALWVFNRCTKQFGFKAIQYITLISPIPMKHLPTKSFSMAHYIILQTYYQRCVSFCRMHSIHILWADLTGRYPTNTILLHTDEAKHYSFPTSLRGFTSRRYTEPLHWPAGSTMSLCGTRRLEFLRCPTTFCSLRSLSSCKVYHTESQEH